MIELSMMSVVAVAVILFSLDVCFMLMGTQLNDKACRDAARAAAQTNSRAAALTAAQAAAAVHYADGYFVTAPTVDTATLEYEDFDGSPPPDTSPYVSVTTTTLVRIPCPVFVWGVTYGKNREQVLFSRTYQFPIVKTQLYL